MPSINSQSLSRIKKQFPNNPEKRFIGLIRIYNDIDRVHEKTLEIINKCKTQPNHTHFDDYQDISITYRKCFYADKRGISLSGKKFFNGTTLEQKELHQRLKNLANTHTAHCDSKEYDNADLYYVIDNSSKKAAHLDIHQAIYEPLGCNDFKEIADLIIKLKQNIINEKNDIETKIINDYNSPTL